jgi:hypothetical protein
MLLNAKTVPSLSSASTNYILTIWTTHPSAKTRGSFSFTVGAFQGAFHSLYSELVYLKKLQSAIVSPNHHLTDA